MPVTSAPMTCLLLHSNPVLMNWLFCHVYSFSVPPLHLSAPVLVTCVSRETFSFSFLNGARRSPAPPSDVYTILHRRRCLRILRPCNLADDFFFPFFFWMPFNKRRPFLLTAPKTINTPWSYGDAVGPQVLRLQIWILVNWSRYTRTCFHNQMNDICVWSGSGIHLLRHVKKKKGSSTECFSFNGVYKKKEEEKTFPWLQLCCLAISTRWNRSQMLRPWVISVVLLSEFYSYQIAQTSFWCLL